MVAVFTKELLSWYLITLKLKETVESGTPLQQHEEGEEEEKQLPQSDVLQIENNPEPEKSPPESEWVITIREKLDQARKDDVALIWGKLCIYKVPHYLRQGNERAYVPNIVSLGPYHHGNPRLREMECHKWRAFYQILKRTKQDVKLYLDAIKELEEKARDCYEGPITLSSEEFVEMMVLDGCFILELFRGAAQGFTELGYFRSDPVFAMRGSMHSIQRDMIMLENQIPLFVLDRLIELQFGQTDQRGIIEKLTLQFFDPLMPTDEPLTKTELNKLESSLGHVKPFNPLSEQGDLHCLDVFRKSILRRGPNPEPRKWMKRWSRTNCVVDKRRTQLIHCVTELKEAGIKFKKRKTDRFWDIKFKDGVLKIPRLLIHDGTKSLFLNLIAFEQCQLECGNEITSYVVFMDNLINSPEDVGLLHYHGIVEHWLGSDAEVAELFNRLCQEVVFDINNSYLSPLSEKVNEYHDHRWNAWRASLIHNYFNNPWSVISFVAAVVLLLLTLAQTFYGIYGYYKPLS